MVPRGPGIARADGRSERLTLASMYCESGHVSVWDTMLPQPVRGDLMEDPVAGAYCLAMASGDNCARRPATVAHKAGRVELWQRRETIEHLLARELGAEGACYC